MKNNVTLVYSVCLVVGDFLALIAAFIVAYVLRVTLDHTPISAEVHALTYITIVAALLPFFILIFALLGLYNSRVHDNRFNELWRLLIGVFVGILGVISYSYIANVRIFPARLVTLYGFLLAFFFVLLFRTIARGIRRALFSYGVGITNVLIVGDTKLTLELVKSLSAPSRNGYRVVGIVGCDKCQPDESFTGKCFDNFESAVAKLGSRLHMIVQTELYAAAAKNDVILVYAQEHHLEYRFVPGNSELFTGNIDTELFQSIPMIAVNQTALTGWGRVVKRLTDIVLGSIILLIAIIPMLLITLALKITEPRGKVFYRPKRMSRFGHTINFYKFRTMYQKYCTTPEEGFTKMGRPDLLKQYRANGDFLEHDPRITPIGRFLRKTSLDELPQLMSVVKGDISLVGPRALDTIEMESYAKKHLILAVKTGITGLAVVSGRRDIPFEERRKLDLYYVQNWSFWGDLVILVRTAWIVLTNKGAK